MAASTLADDAAILQALCESGHATRGTVVRVARGALDVGRDEPAFDSDQLEFVRRGRLAPLGGGRYGLSIVRHTGRLERVPFAGTLAELHDVMESILPHIFGAW